MILRLIGMLLVSGCVAADSASNSAAQQASARDVEHQPSGLQIRCRAGAALRDCGIEDPWDRRRGDDSVVFSFSSSVGAPGLDSLHLLGQFELLRSTDELQDDFRLDTLTRWIVLPVSVEMAGERPEATISMLGLQERFAPSRSMRLTEIRAFVSRGRYLIARASLPLMWPSD